MEARGEVLQVGPGSADIVEIPCCAKWGIKLIRELTHGEVLPPFNADLIGKMREDVQRVFGEVFKLIEEMDSEEPTPLEEAQHYGLTVKLAAVQRAVNCAHAYAAERRRAIENLRWERGVVLGDDTRANLDESEQEYFHEYCNLVAEYMAGEGLDITADLGQPPVCFRVAVRANTDIYAMTSNGAVNLKKGSVAYLLREDVEPYVRDGSVEIVHHL